MRIVAVLAALAVAVAAGLLAWGALSNLWSDYRDSGTWTYLGIGGAALAVCVASLLCARSLWRGR